MMRIARPLAFTLACFLVGGGPVFASTAEDTVDVDHLIAAYHEAVIGHDAPRLSALFVPSGTAWFSVLSDDGLARVRAKTPDAPKLRPGTMQGFVKMVGSSKARLDPRRSNLRITTDGTIASVTFDFRFFIDGKEENRGSESWQLVKAAEGWRIASIVYSSNPPAS